MIVQLVDEIGEAFGHPLRAAAVEDRQPALTTLNLEPLGRPEPNRSGWPLFSCRVGSLLQGRGQRPLRSFAARDGPPPTRSRTRPTSPRFRSGSGMRTSPRRGSTPILCEPSVKIFNCFLFFNLSRNGTDQFQNRCKIHSVLSDTNKYC